MTVSNEKVVRLLRQVERCSSARRCASRERDDVLEAEFNIVGIDVGAEGDARVLSKNGDQGRFARAVGTGDDNEAVLRHRSAGFDERLA
jgi:hypothetical protein